MKANGNLISLVVTENNSWLMDHYMKENSKMVPNTVMECIIGLITHHILELGKIMNLMAKEPTPGVTEGSTLASGEKI